MATKETKHSVNIVIKAFDKASKKFKKIGLAGTKMALTFGKNVIGKSFSFLSNMITKIITQFKRLIKVAAVAAAATSFFIIKLGATFEKTMSKVKALTGATAREFKRLEQTAKELGETTEFTASQISEAMSELALSSFKTNDIIRVMPSVLNLASAGGLDLAESVSIATGIMGGMDLQAKKLGGTVDILVKGFTTSRTDLTDLGEAMKTAGPIAKQTGKDITEVVAVLMSLANANFRGQEGGTALRNILINLSNTSGATSKAINKLVSSVKDARGNMRPMADIIEEMNSSLSRLDKVDQTSLLIEAFGKRAGPAMAALLGKGAKAVRDYEKELKKAGGTSKTIAKILLDNVAGSVTKLRSQIEGLSLSIFDFYKVQMKNFVDSIRESLTKNRDNIVKWAGTFVSKVLLVKDILFDLAVFMKNDWRKSMQFAFDSFVTMAKASFDTVIRLAIVSGQAIWKGLTTFVGPSAREIHEKAMEIVERENLKTKKFVQSDVPFAARPSPSFLREFEVESVKGLRERAIKELEQENINTIAGDAFDDIVGIWKNAIKDVEANIPKTLAVEMAKSLEKDRIRIAKIQAEIAAKQAQRTNQTIIQQATAEVSRSIETGKPESIVKTRAKDRGPLVAQETRFLTMAGRRDPAVDTAKNTADTAKEAKRTWKEVRELRKELQRDPRFGGSPGAAILPTNFP